MAKRKHDIIEKWSVPNKKTGKRRYYIHVLYANGNVGPHESWASRSGRSRRINKMLEIDPSLEVRDRVKK